MSARIINFLSPRKIDIEAPEAEITAKPDNARNRYNENMDGSGTGSKYDGSLCDEGQEEQTHVPTSPSKNAAKRAKRKRRVEKKKQLR